MTISPSSCTFGAEWVVATFLTVSPVLESVTECLGPDPVGMTDGAVGQDGRLPSAAAAVPQGRVPFLDIERRSFWRTLAPRCGAIWIGEQLHDNVLPSSQRFFRRFHCSMRALTNSATVTLLAST